MADRKLALLDLHLRETPSPPPDVVDALARDGLVHLIAPRQHERIMHRVALRARIDEIDAERHRLNTAIVWPWRLLWRIRQIERLSYRLDALTEQSRALRTQLHEEGLARAEPETLIPLSDGRFAILTPEGVNSLHGWMYSGALDQYVDAGAGAGFAEWTMDACERLRSEWRVAWPPPTVSCAAALLARAGEEHREALLEALIALFGEWRRRYRDCPADRLVLGALMVLPDDARGGPAEGERRALDYQQALHDRGFPLERETLWAGALLALHGASREIAPRVHAIWRGLIIAGWTMSAQTYPYAARLALAHGNPTAITSRVQGIFERVSPRVITTTGTKAIAASVLAQSDLHPQPVRRTARILEEQTRWDAAAERLLALHERLPAPGVEIPGADTRSVLAAILAQMPGSEALVLDSFHATLAALRGQAATTMSRAADTGLDPLTGAALLLMDRGWHGRADNAIFSLEACACCRNEHWDPVTIFRLSAVDGPVWQPKSPGGVGV